MASVWRRRLLPVLAVVVPFVVYLRTMAPTVYGLDSAELTTGSYVLGIVHSPGSPLFLLLGHVFTWLPFGDVGYRVNLLSAVAAAVGVGFVYLVLLRLTRDALLSLAGSWCLAFTYYFWVSALAAELYALHACFVAGLILLALRWYERPGPLELCGFTFGFGLATGNHLSMSVLAPGYAYLLTAAPVDRWRRPRVLLPAIGCGLLGACVYLYLPLRGMAGTPLDYARNWGVDVTTWQGFWWMVSGEMFGPRFFAVPATQLPTEVGLYAYRLWSNFVGLGCLFGIVGLYDDLPRHRAIHVALLLMFAGHLAFMLTYNVGDKELMLVPTYLIWDVWVALGVQATVRYVAQRTSGRVALSAGALLLVMSAGNLVVNFGRVDISDDLSARQRGETLFSGLPPHSVFIGTWADVPILEYLQLVEHERPDVETMNLFFVHGSERAQFLASRLATGRPLYTSVPKLFGGVPATFEHEAACDCYRIEVRPSPGLAPGSS